MKVSKLILGLMAAAVLASTAQAQAFPEKTGYVIDARGNIARNNYGECWRTGYWTPAMALAECDADLVKKADPAPAPAAATPAAATRAIVADTGPAKPAFEKVTLKAETLFDFNKATLRPAGMEALNDVAAKMQQYTHVELVGITGHADRIGNDKYNMKLSQKRADAVKNYLVSKGVDAKRLEAAGKGETEPVVDCKNVKGKEHRSNKKLVECLQPNRRVVVEIKMQKS